MIRKNGLFSPKENYIQNRQNILGRARAKTLKKRKSSEADTVIYLQLLSALDHEN